MKKKITIKDIAKALNISKTAISFVLNGKARENHISIDLEKKVLDYIEKVGYRPNLSAQTLRTGKTKVIGMMIEDISDPFFSSISRYVEEIAYNNGYKIFYCSTENNTQKTLDLIATYRHRGLDGYIIAPPPGVEDGLKELVREGRPVVVFDRTLPGFTSDSVVINNYQSSYDAVRYLLDNGYQNIAMITLDSNQMQMKDRQQGYTDALDSARRPYMIKKTFYHDDQENAICEIQEFLATNKQIDALFFTTNYITENGLEAIRNLELKIPDDVGVIVFDDHNHFRLFTPSITAIAQPIKEMAENVINIMLQRLSESEAPKEYKNVVLNSKLMARNSSLPKPNRG